MSIENVDEVDVVSVDKKSGHVVLTISDHLDWSDTIKHQTLLQKKFNSYLAFVESGEILERYPDAKGRPIKLKVIFKVRPDTEGLRFLGRAKTVIESAGVSPCHEIFSDSYDNWGSG
jgi:hypothetical protein